MRKQTVPSGYVLTESGEYYVQLPDDNQWGFIIVEALDDTSTQSYDGGFGLLDNQSWGLVPTNDVPKEVQERLGWLLEE